MIARSRFISVYILLIAVGLYTNFHADALVPMNRSFAEFPVAHRQWRMVSQDTFSEGILATLKPTDYLSRVYAGPGGKTVQLYIGYHGGGKDGGEIHSPNHCLPGSGWYKLSSRPETLAVAGKQVHFIQSVFMKGEQKELFLYWFQIKDRSITSEYSLKLAQIANSILQSRRDATFIRISVPCEMDEKRAFSAGEAFIRDFYPVIRGFLPGGGGQLSQEEAAALEWHAGNAV